MANLTRDEILARKVGRGTCTLPDGSTVTVRALTRDQVLHAQNEAGGDASERDNWIVAMGLVDPVMSVDDVREWAEHGAAGDLTTITEMIAELSGLKQGAGKSVPDGS